MAKILGAQIPEEIKNLAINGNFDYWQRVETTTTTINSSSSNSGYTADMVSYSYGGTTNKNFSIAQSSNVPSQAQSGFESQLSYLNTMITGISSPAAGDYIAPFLYKMEGFDYQRIHNKTVTFGFWVYASVSGTYTFALENSVPNRCYVTTFSVSGSNTWQYISITVQMDNVTTGWVFSNGIGLTVVIGAYGGTTFQTSTLGSWQSGNIFVASTATNWMSTSSAVFQISQFSIVEGPLGFSATGFQRAGKTIQQELSLCQRYYEKSYDIGQAPGSGSGHTEWYWSVTTAGASNQKTVPFRVSKRTDAAVTPYSNSTQAVNTVFNNNTASNIAATVSAASQNGYIVNFASATTDQYSWYWTAEAGL